ncbi:MAG: flagellar export protein FliJ [Treponema sp.]|nr:flagellar export protein FliJ [Treponema sp.]
MKRFRFNLEKVLKLREHNEQEAKIELGRATSALAEIEKKIDDNARARAQSATERFSALGGGGASGALSMFSWDAYIQRLELEALVLAEQAAKAEKIVEEKRELYVAASRELKAMEKLREKRALEHRKEMFAGQTRELDDLRRALP